MEVSPPKYLFVWVSICIMSERRLHPVARNHGARHFGHLLDIIRSAGRDAAEDDLFGGATAC